MDEIRRNRVGCFFLSDAGFVPDRKLYAPNGEATAPLEEIPLVFSIAPWGVSGVAEFNMAPSGLSGVAAFRNAPVGLRIPVEPRAIYLGSN